MSDSRDRILVVDDSELILKLVIDVLSRAGFEVITAESAESALRLLASDLPDLIVSDVTMPGMDGYELCRRLKSDSRTASIPIIMLTSAGDINAKVRGFEAGTDDYLVKPFDPTELDLRIRALLARARVAMKPMEALPPEGRLISTFSLRGGVGKSTLATNLAVSLAHLWNIEIALVDLALEVDQVAMMFNLRPKLTWAGLAEIGANEMDEDVVLGHLVSHESGVHILAAPPSPALAGLVTPQLVERVLSVLRSRYEYVVVDMASAFSEISLVTMDLSDLLIMVLAPELASLKASRTTLDIWQSLGYSHDRIATVLNWTFPKKGLPQTNIEKALGMPMDLVLPYGQTALVDAINTGIPYVLSHTTARLSVEIQKFAYRISAMDMHEPLDEPASQMLQRVRTILSREASRD